ncbi:extracellular solute-binding protein [Paenibacillus solisilvae]|uniref:Extracellular solute-binding protein n=1 Tax=Paenibacillus solisilvae TaxID=2486751 RepID=A0ABW0VYR0_9BACL
MKTNKIVTVFMIVTFVLAMLAGCSSQSNDSKESAVNNKANEQTPDPSADPSAEPTPTPEEEPAWQKEKISLKFASWEDEKVVKPMLDAFMAKYPNITVEKDQSINWPWTAALTTAASAGNLPDVFSLESVTPGVQNDWLYDISQLWDNDSESATVYPNIAKYGVYGGKRLAAPTWQSIMGVFVNKKLFEKANVPLPKYNWTIDEMVDLAKKLTNTKDHIFGIDGPWGDLSFESYWPMQNDASLGWGTFDGEKFNMGHNQDWMNGYNTKVELRRLKVEENMTVDEKKKVFGDENAWVFQKGNVAMGIDGSWNIGWLPGELQKAGAGELDFYPYPGGKAGQRLPIILDFAGISSTTKNPEASFELLKWMYWSKEGLLKRIEIYETLGKNISDLFPVSSDKEIWDKLKSKTTIPGVKAMMDMLDTGVPDNGKSLPGLPEYDQWFAEQKIAEKIDKGEFTPADKAQEIEDKLNEFVTKAKQALGE